MSENYVAPEFGKDAFNCPHCHIHAHQDWFAFKNFNQWRGFLQSLQGLPMMGQMGMGFPNNSLALMVGNFIESPQIIERSELAGAQCSHCNKYSYWVDKKLIYPPDCAAPMPADDMPEDCKKLYEEAREIADKSPRGAGALIRLCLEKLLIELGGNPKNKITDNIGSLLVAEKINERIQKAADLCRLNGNAFVHPSAINLEDSDKTVLRLFKLINLIVENAITEPKELEADFGSLPDTKKEEIDKRNKKAREKTAHKS